MKNVLKVTDFIGKIAVYVLTFSLLFIIQKYTIGYIGGLRKVVVFSKYYLYELIFAVTSIILIMFFIRVYSPNSKRKESKC